MVLSLRMVEEMLAARGIIGIRPERAALHASA
jgi:transposase-like protein